MSQEIDGKPVFGPPRPRAKVVLLSMEKQSWFNEMFDALLIAMRDAADVEEVADAASARLAFSASPRPTAVLVTDEALTASTRISLLHDAAAYARSGGRLIFAGHFSSFARPPDIRAMFATIGLSWESGDYHRTTFYVNPALTHFSVSNLTPSYSQKALHMQHVNHTDAVYLPSESSVIESRVFTPDPIQKLEQTPAAITSFGRGKVGYVGDVNAEKETTAVVLAMCGVPV